MSFKVRIHVLLSLTCFDPVSQVIRMSRSWLSLVSTTQSRSSLPIAVPSQMPRLASISAPPSMALLAILLSQVEEERARAPMMRGRSVQRGLQAARECIRAIRF